MGTILIWLYLLALCGISFSQGKYAQYTVQFGVFNFNYDLFKVPVHNKTLPQRTLQEQTKQVVVKSK